MKNEILIYLKCICMNSLYGIKSFSILYAKSLFYSVNIIFLLFIFSLSKSSLSEVINNVLMQDTILLYKYYITILFCISIFCICIGICKNIYKDNFSFPYTVIFENEKGYVVNAFEYQLRMKSDKKIIRVPLLIEINNTDYEIRDNRLYILNGKDSISYDLSEIQSIENYYNIERAEKNRED